MAEALSIQVLETILSPKPPVTHKESQLRTIGLGSCGTVFEIPGTELAYKKGSIEADIWRDFCLTNRVHIAPRAVQPLLQNTFQDLTIPRTPRCHSFHTVQDEDFWSATTLHRFPLDHRTKKPLFTVDRIAPIPPKAREALIHLYFDPDEGIQRDAKHSPNNTDWLLRIYLGERESSWQQASVYDSLRNLPLRLNMLEELGVDTVQLAREMVIGLAIMHWRAKIDAMDVEFVLASSATWDTDQFVLFDDLSTPPHTVKKAINSKRRAVHIWMLDFDKASEIRFSAHDVDSKLVPAFLGNDPYFPVPGVEWGLWDVFCKAYLKASEVILGGKGGGGDENVGRCQGGFWRGW